MEGFYLLCAFSLAMFAGSFFVGSIPLVFNMSESRTRLLSFFGAGLLVGTALSVIVPEGVESLYLVETEAVISDVPKHSSAADHVDLIYINRAIGISLIAGFLFMLLVDQVTRSASSKEGVRIRYKLTATIGLVVHAAADGVAVGSAAATNHPDVQSVIFLAVILHKAPAAIGLVSFLLMECVERFKIRRHLLIFSAAAPVAALVTYYLLAVFVRDSFSSNSLTGILLLFSGGTFLYVATVHILPELVDSGTDYQLLGTDNAGHAHSASGSPLAMKELLSIFVGAIVPVFLSSGHSH